MDVVSNIFLAVGCMLIVGIAIAFLLRNEMRDFARFVVLLLFGVLIPGSICGLGLVYWQEDEFFTGGLYMAFSSVWWILVLSVFRS